MDTLSKHFDIANLDQILAVFNANGDSVFVNNSLKDETRNGFKGPDTMWVQLRKSAMETILLRRRYVELEVADEKALMLPLKIDQETFAVLLPAKRRNNKAVRFNDELLHQLKLMATHATYVASLIEVNGGLTYVSPSAGNILGYSAAEMMTHPEEHGLLEPYKKRVFKVPGRSQIG